MEAVETLEDEATGVIVSLYQDDCPNNPREDGDWHVSILTQLNDRFIQPDSNYDSRIVEAWERAYYVTRGQRNRRDTEFVERYARAFLDAVAVDWYDDYQGGRVFGYITNEVAEREGIPHPTSYLQNELKEYRAWVEGDVYGIIVESSGDELDSCWGYYGYEYAMEELKMWFDSHVAYTHKERAKMFSEVFHSDKERHLNV